MVMRCLIIYDNPLLNDRDFLHQAHRRKMLKKVHRLASEKYEEARFLLMESNYRAIDNLLH